MKIQIRKTDNFFANDLPNMRSSNRNLYSDKESLKIAMKLTINSLWINDRYLILGLVAVLLATQPASAYLDPGAGSFYWQMLIGIVLGAGFMVKIYYNKIKNRFFRS
jgi:hypothetical protein